MKKSFLGKYFKREERKAKKLHHEVDPSSWPEYLTATQSRVRRVMVEQRAMPRVNKVASSVESLYMDETAQDVAHAQVSKSKRGNLPKKLTPGTVLAWGGWGIAMFTFASSLLLNFPFGAGAFILKAIPGEPRLGDVVLLQPGGKELHPEDITEVNLSLAGVGKKNIQHLSVTLSYDPNTLELQEMSTQDSSFTTVQESHYDAKAGRAFISLENENSDSETLALAKLTFKVKAFIGNTTLHIIPDTSIVEAKNKTSIPKKLGELTLHVAKASPAPAIVPLGNKRTQVTLDGNLDDWRDVISYHPVSFKPSGTPITEKNIQEGRVISEKDFSGVLQLAEDAQNYYVAFSANDDEVLADDSVAIKLGSQIFAVPVLEAANRSYSANNIHARATKQAIGYILEVQIPKTAATSISTQKFPFNFEVHDVDSQDSAVLVLSSPNDSEVKP